jgi:hypothetical protein
MKRLGLDPPSGDRIDAVGAAAGALRHPGREGARSRVRLRERVPRGRGRMARADYLRETVTQLPSIVLEMALLGFILAYFALTIVRGGAAQDTLSVLGLFAYAGLRLQPSLQLIVSGLNALKFSSAPLQDLHDDVATHGPASVSRQAATPLPFSSSAPALRSSASATSARPGTRWRASTSPSTPGADRHLRADGWRQDHPGRHHHRPAAADQRAE